jgi:hypothetical protein
VCLEEGGMSQPLAPPDPWSEEPLGALPLDDARAELAAIRRELMGRLVTVLSRKSDPSTAGLRHIAIPYQPDRRPGGIRRMRDANARGADFRFDISNSGPTFAKWHEAMLALALIVSGTIVSLPPMKLALWTAGSLGIAHLMTRIMRGK